MSELITEDWKLKSRTVVKLYRTRSVFESFRLRWRRGFVVVVIWGKKLIVYEYLCIQKLTIFFFLTFCKV